MRRQTLLGFLAGVAATVVVGLVVGAEQPAAPATPAVAGPVGRYQPTRLDGANLCVTDTTTGRLWLFSVASKTWYDHGPPPR